MSRYRDVWRPRCACVCAVGIKQLRLKIVRAFACCTKRRQPAISAPLKCAKPMPFVCGDIVIDSHSARQSLRRHLLRANITSVRRCCKLGGRPESTRATTAQHVSVIM